MHMDVYGDHGGAITALLYLPVFLVAAAFAVDRAAAAGSRIALRFVAGFRQATPARRALALLIFVTATIHAGLVPGHLDEDSTLAALFALDCVALTAAAGTAFGPRPAAWRPAVAALLVANLVAYVAYLAVGAETVDVVGMASKAVELAALVLVIHPATAFVGMGERGNRRLETITERRIAQ